MKTKQMKPSEAMLKGFAMAGGHQYVGWFYEGDARYPNAVCAIGAMRLGYTGNAGGSLITPKLSKTISAAFNAFLKEFDCSFTEANDGNAREQSGVPMSIPDIAGILASEGY